MCQVTSTRDIDMEDIALPHTLHTGSGNNIAHQDVLKEVDWLIFSFIHSTKFNSFYEIFALKLSL